jgi:hypothetical protein
MKKKLNKYFIPGEHNDHQPHFLRNKSVGIFIVSIFIFEIIALSLFTPIVSEKLNDLAAVFPSVLVKKTNEERSSVGKNSLESNDLLTQAAQLKANDMAEKGYFSHVSPEGKDPWHWVNLSGYKYKNAGENLAVNFIDSKEVHNAWMNSPTHEANILRDNFTEIGIATAEGEYKGKKAIFVAQFFGEPASQDPIIDFPVFVQDDVVDLIVEQDQEIEIFTENLNEDPLVLGVETVYAQDVTITEELKSSPKTVITYILYLVEFIVLLAIFMKVFIKVRKQYPKLIMNGVVLVLVIAALIYTNRVLLNIFSEIA